MLRRRQEGPDPVRDAVAYAHALSRLDEVGARRILTGYPDAEVLLMLLGVLLGAEVRTVAALSEVPEQAVWERLATTCDWLR